MVAIRKRDGQPARSAQRRCQRGSTKRALMSRRQSHSAQHAGRKGFRKILHMLLIIGRQEKEKEQHKRTCLKKLSARCLESSRLASSPQNRRQEKTYTRSKQIHQQRKRKKLPITMPFVQRRNPAHRYSLILRTKKRRYPTSRVSADADGAPTSPTRDRYSQQKGSSRHRMTYRRRKREMYQHALLRGCCTSYSSSSARALQCLVLMCCQNSRWALLRRPDHGQ